MKLIISLTLCILSISVLGQDKDYRLIPNKNGFYCDGDSSLGFFIIDYFKDDRLITRKEFRNNKLVTSVITNKTLDTMYQMSIYPTGIVAEKTTFLMKENGKCPLTSIWECTYFNRILKEIYDRNGKLTEKDYYEKVYFKGTYEVNSNLIKQEYFKNGKLLYCYSYTYDEYGKQISKVKK